LSLGLGRCSHRKSETSNGCQRNMSKFTHYHSPHLFREESKRNGCVGSRRVQAAALVAVEKRLPNA
jgi:hypothetical protein